MKLSKSEILATMQDIVELKVDLYKSDYYEYDVEVIEKMKHQERRLWMVRDTGTYFFLDPYVAETCMDMDQYIFFAIIEKTGDQYEYTEVDEAGARAYIKAEKRLYRYRIESSKGGTYGPFKSESEARQLIDDLYQKQREAGQYNGYGYYTEYYLREVA